MTVSAAIDFNEIETVFLDMDGTLLDLNFDNLFWQKYIPARYAELNAMDAAEAAVLLAPRFARVEGQLDWYCLDYWSRELGFDVAALKRECRDEICLLPDTAAFLARLGGTGVRRVLLTNAHPVALAIKLEATAIDDRFDAIISSHQLGVAKQHPDFWPRLNRIEPYSPAATLLVDDSLSVLEAARAAGIGHLRAISRPDSRQPLRRVEGFVAVENVLALFGDKTPSPLRG